LDESTADKKLELHEWWYDAIAMIVEFREERDWARYHQPRNLALALMGELGELAEILQFDGDEVTEISELKYEELSKEMADVTIYTLGLATVLPNKNENAYGATSFETQLLHRVEQLFQQS
jgi:NTP pyrophosphatase (non-canonical NTP hydrolase)